MTTAAPRKHRVGAALANVEVLDQETFIHTYEAPEIAREARPGQFVHIRVSHLSAPLLRRPISLLWSDGERFIQVLFKVVRTGTALLAQKREGEVIDIVGPLGNPFPYARDRDSVMIAGGYGIAPVYYLARIHRTDPGHRTLIYGARGAEQLYIREQLEAVFDDVIYTTEDDSLGQKGLVTRPLADLLAARTNLAVYACGPTPMLAAVSRMVGARGADAPGCWVSMENQMGCGFGACLGCVIRTVDGFATTCKQGPVFDSRVVVFD